MEKEEVAALGSATGTLWESEGRHGSPQQACARDVSLILPGADGQTPLQGRPRGAGESDSKLPEGRERVSLVQ